MEIKKGINASVFVSLISWFSDPLKTSFANPRLPKYLCILSNS